MDVLLRLFLRLHNVVSEIRLGTTLHIALTVLGIGTLYLLTVREDERGRIEDYLSRLWKRIYKLRAKALSRHLTFLRVTSGAITSFMDILFGPDLFSLQANGVSVALAFFCLNFYMFLSHGKKDSDYLFNVTSFLALALFPSALDALFARRRKQSLKQVWKFFMDHSVNLVHLQ